MMDITPSLVATSVLGRCRKGVDSISDESSKLVTIDKQSNP